MATKTITIMDDAYDLLVQHKRENESFSAEIRRLLSEKKKKSLVDFFGILSNNEAKGLHEDLKEIRKKNLQLLREELK